MNYAIIARLIPFRRVLSSDADNHDYHLIKLVTGTKGKNEGGLYMRVTSWYRKIHGSRCGLPPRRPSTALSTLESGQDRPPAVTYSLTIYMQFQRVGAAPRRPTLEKDTNLSSSAQLELRVSISRVYCVKGFSCKTALVTKS